MSELAGCDQGDEQNVFHFTKGHNKLPDDGKLDVEFEPHNTATFVDIFSPVIHIEHPHSLTPENSRAHTHISVKYEGKRKSFPHVPFVFYVLCNEMKVRATYFVSVLAELPRRGRQGTSSFHSCRQPHIHAQQALPQDGSK